MDKIIRIIDANFNRAREGLRVIEDGLRFYYNADTSLIKKIKNLRHSLSITVDKYFGLTEIKKGRDVSGDKGKGIDRKEREDIRDVIERNFLRVSEALRVMEEYSRTVFPSASTSFHNLRFQLYKIEKEILLAIKKRKEIPVPFISVLIKITKNTPITDIKKIIDGKPDGLMVSSGTDEKQFLKTARKIKEILPECIAYIIYGRADICLLADADGIYLERNHLPAAEVKKILQDKVILTEGKKNININLTGNINTVKSILKKHFTKNTHCIILIAGEKIPEDIEKIIKVVRKEVKNYGRRREETAGRK